MLGLEPLLVAAFVGIIAGAIWFAFVGLKAGKCVRDSETFYAGTNLTPQEYDDTYLVTNVAFTAVLLIFTEIGYHYRYWAMAAPLIWIGGLYLARVLFVNVFMPKFGDISPRTLHEFCGQRFGGAVPLRQALAAATIIGFVGTIAIEVIGMLYALTTFGLQLPIVLPVFITAVFVSMIVYAQRSGFPGVIATDRIQKWILIICYTLLLLVPIWLIFATTDVVAMTAGPGTVSVEPSIGDGLLLILGFVFLFAPFQICMADMWQRCHATQWQADVVHRMASPKIVLLFAIAFVVPIWIGIEAAEAKIPHPESGYLFLYLLHQLLSGLPPYVGCVLTSILFLAILAGTMSTADTLLVGAGYIFQYDWHFALKSDVPQEDHKLRLVRDAVVVAGITSLAIAWFELFLPSLSIVDIGWAIFSNQISFTPILLYAALAPRRVRTMGAGSLSAFVYCAMLIAFILASLGAVLKQDIVTHIAPLCGILITTVGVLMHLTKWNSKNGDEDEDSGAGDSKPQADTGDATVVDDGKDD